MKLRYLSLFSGIEACSVAWKELGWECVAVAEIDPFCNTLLAHYYPNTPNLGDVSKITEDDIKALGDIDLIVFGSPCQDLSVAGKRAGFDGERSSLFYHAMRIVNYARKYNNLRFALWENVKGAFSSNKGRDFGSVVSQMAGIAKCPPPQGWKNAGMALGDDALLEWRVLDAQFFGVAQRRKRVFALADFGVWQDRPPVLFEQDSLFGDNQTSHDTGQDPTAQAGRNPTSPSEQPTCFGVIADITPKASDNLMGTLRATGGGGVTPPLVVYAFDARQSFGTQANLAYTLCATDYKGTQAVYAIAGNIIGRDDKHGGNGVGVQENTSYTLTTTDRHAVSDLQGLARQLTPIECERLMGFHDDYTKIAYRGKPAEQCPKSQRYKALGNSMAVPVMRWIGERIVWALNHQE